VCVCVCVCAEAEEGRQRLEQVEQHQAEEARLRASQLLDEQRARGGAAPRLTERAGPAPHPSTSY